MGTFSTTLPDGTVLSGIPEGTTQSQILDKYNRSKALSTPPSGPEEDTGEFTKGAIRAGKEGYAAVTEAIPAVAKSLSNQTFGTKFDNSQNIQAYNQQLAETQKEYGAKVPTFKDIHSPGDVVDYIAGNLGEQLPNIAVGMAGGLGGSSISRLMAENVAKSTGIALSDAELQSAMKKGAAVGIGASMLPQNVSGNYVDYMNKGQDRPYTALMTGGLQTAVQMLPEIKVMNKLLGPEMANQVVADSILKKAGVGAVEGGATFGAANVGSSAIGLLGDHFVDDKQELFNKENLNQLIDQGLKGLVAGGVLGAGLAPLHGKAAPDTGIDPKAKPEYTPTHSNMQPTYVPDPVIKAAQDHGVNTDSLMKLHPAQVQEVQASMAREVPKELNPQDLAANMERRTAAEKTLDKNRSVWDTSFNKPLDKDYTPGDGVIKAGATVRDDDIIGHPAQKVEVDDINQLEAKLQTGKKPDDLGFTSKLSDLIDEKMPNNLTPEGIRQVLNSWSKQGLFKNEELEYSGLDKYLAGKDPGEKISKTDLIEGLQQLPLNAVKVKNPGHMDNYTLEGKNTKGYEEQALELTTKPSASGQFEGSHLHPALRNVLVHWRSSLKRVDHKPTRFIEEIQSDWHQQGAEMGYGKAHSGAELQDVHDLEQQASEIKDDIVNEMRNSVNYSSGINAQFLRDLELYHDALTDEDRARGHTWENAPVWKENKDYVGSNVKDMIESYFLLNDTINGLRGVPDAPFKKTWSQLALKKILIDAVKNGEDQIAIPKKEAVAEIQNHSDHRAGKFYEERLVNELKHLAKQYGLKISESYYRKPLDSMGLLRLIDKAIEEHGDGLRPNSWWNKLANEQMHKPSSESRTKLVKYLESFRGKDYQAQWAHFKETKDAFEKDYPKFLDYPVTLVEIPPEARAKIAEGMPLFQKGEKLNHGPITGNLFHDGIVPTELARNLKALPLTDAFKEKFAAHIEGLHKLVKEVFGPHTAELKLWSHLSDGDFSKDPVLGAQLVNTIHLALNDSTRDPKIPETFYHESFHMLMDRGAYTPSELKFMLNDANMKVLKKAFDADDHLKGQDWDRFINTPGGREEILANYMGKAAKEYNADRKLSSIPEPFRTAFRKFKTFLEKAASYLKGQGYHSMNDIVRSMVEGDRAADTTDYASRDFLDKYNPQVSDMTHNLGFARLQKLAKARRDLDELEGLDKFKYLAEQARIGFNNLRQSGDLKRMGLWGRWVRSMYNEGIQDPSMMSGLVVNSTVRRMDHAQTMLSEMGELIHPFSNLSKDLRYRICEIADTLNQSKLKAYIHTDGTLRYKDKTGQEYSIQVGKDAAQQKEVAQGYMALQAGFAKQREHYLKAVKEFAYNHEVEGRKLGALIHPDANFSMEHLKEALGNLSSVSEDHPVNREIYQKLSNLKDQMEAIEAMGQSDYIPNTRFGQYGYSVRDIKDNGEDPEGKLVHFATVEQGAYNGTYNEKNHKEVLAELKAKYGDKERYKIMGNGELTSFDHKTAKPFLMTYARESKGIDRRFVNIETMSSLLADHSVDPMAYTNIREQLSQDILQSQFKHKFERKEGIGGYSRDWDRVVNGHMTGSSHFLSGLYHQRELGILAAEIPKVADERWRDKAQKFLEYVNTPQEDLQRLRTMNMLWVMGGNVGTAMTVAMTLPTTTLGQLAKYDPNFLRNGKLMSKWSVLSHQILASTNPREVLKGMVEKGKVHADDAKAFLKFMEMGKVRSEMMSESVSALKQDALSNASRYLGAPIAYMERMVRAATLMAAHETIRSNPDARARAERVLEKDGNFQASRLMDKSQTFEQAVSLNVMDKAHGVYGKIGRPDAFKGVGGALFFPFQTFPYYALSGLAHMLGEGKEGKIALATTLGSLLFFCGIQGIPGVEPLEELYETITKNLGHEQNGELMFLEKVYGLTHDWKAAEFLTHGFGRTFMGMDGSKRWGLPIVGYDMFKALTGMGGSKPSSIMGVEGTVLQGLGNMWNEYNNGGGTLNALKAMAPYGVSNSLKALSYATDGVWTNPNGQGMKSQLIPKEDVSAWTMATRALGVTSSQVAEAREANFYNKLLNTQFTPLYDQYKARMALAETQYVQALKDKKFDKARELRAKMTELGKKFGEDLKEYQTIAPMGALNSVIRKKVNENISGEKPYSKNPTVAKQQYDLRKAEKSDE